MKTKIIISLAALTFGLLAGPSLAAERIAEFSGEVSTETAEFEVRSPFLVDWVAKTDYPGSMGLTITLINARDGTHEGYIIKTKNMGDGLRLVEQSGTFRLRVDATFARWYLKVDQLTRAEAEEYKEKDPFDF